MLENIFINTESEEYLTESCSKDTNNLFLWNLFIKCWAAFDETKCWAGFNETIQTFDEQIQEKFT